MAEQSTSKKPEIVTPTPPDIKDYDLKKALGDMKLPAMPDIEVVLATHRRNLEALSEANRVALEGAQAVARRHMEIMQATMTWTDRNAKGPVSLRYPLRARRQAGGFAETGLRECRLQHPRTR